MGFGQFEIGQQVAPELDGYRLTFQSRALFG